MGNETYDTMCQEKGWIEFSKTRSTLFSDQDRPSSLLPTESPDTDSSGQFTSNDPPSEDSSISTGEMQAHGYLYGNDQTFKRIKKTVKSISASYKDFGKVPVGLDSAGRNALRYEKAKYLEEKLSNLYDMLEIYAFSRDPDPSQTCDATDETVVGDVNKSMACDDLRFKGFLQIVEVARVALAKGSLSDLEEVIAKLDEDFSSQAKEVLAKIEPLKNDMIAFMQTDQLPSRLSEKEYLKPLKDEVDQFYKSGSLLLVKVLDTSTIVRQSFTEKKNWYWGAMAIYGFVGLYWAFLYVQSLMAVTVAMQKTTKGEGNTTGSLVEQLPSTPFLTIRSLGEQASALVESKTKKFEIFSAQKQRESEIAGTVAHEYGNNIMVIQGLLIMAIDALKSGEFGVTLNYQLKALNACDDAKAIVAPLRESGQPARNRKVTGISLERVLQEETSKLAAEDNQQINVSLDPECMGVLVDECDFLSIIRNLLMNAQDSNAKVNRSAISLSTHPLERLDSEIVMGLLGKTEEGDEFVCIEVGDEGIGISEEIGNSVFNLGYSTKSEQERKRQPGAKGCGLHIVWNKVRENGGVIDFVRNATGGVTFRVFLPKAMKYEIELPTRPDELSNIPLEGGEILLVEDNSDVRELIELMLKARGYATFAVPNAEAALLQVKRREGKNPYCTIISDINLGVDCMSGFDLVSELRAIRCMEPVLLITAYHAHEVSKELDPEKYNFKVLEKPFTPIELYAMLDDNDDDDDDDGVVVGDEDVVVDDGSSLDDDDDGDDGSGLDDGGGGDLEEVFSG